MARTKKNAQGKKEKGKKPVKQASKMKFSTAHKLAVSDLIARRDAVHRGRIMDTAISAIKRKDLPALQTVLEKCSKTADPRKLAAAAVKYDARKELRWLAVVYGKRLHMDAYREAAKADNEKLLAFFASNEGFGRSTLAQSLPIVHNLGLRNRARVWLEQEEANPPIGIVQQDVLAAVAAGDAERLRAIAADPQHALTARTVAVCSKRACVSWVDGNRAVLDQLQAMCAHDQNLLIELHDSAVRNAVSMGSCQLLIWSNDNFPDKKVLNLAAAGLQGNLPFLQLAVDIACDVDMRGVQNAAATAGNLDVFLWARQQEQRQKQHLQRLQQLLLQQQQRQALRLGPVAKIVAAKEAATAAAAAAVAAKSDRALAAEFDELLYTAVHRMGHVAIEQWLRDNVFQGRAPDLSLLPQQEESDVAAAEEEAAAPAAAAAVAVAPMYINTHGSGNAGYAQHANAVDTSEGRIFF